MNDRSFVLKGDLCWNETPERIRTLDNGYLVVEDGLITGAFRAVPEQYKGLRLIDAGNNLIMPGMTDLHVHAPQYLFRGLGMDMELLEWLNTHTFPEESRYKDEEYARQAYTMFVNDMKKSATTRAVVFASIHHPATAILMDLFDKSGMYAYVGKVNMDRNSPDYYRESTEQSLADTEDWILETKDRFERVRPILTPRFTPSCTDRLMEGLGHLQRKYGLPVQSHLSENLSEIDWVKELCPWAPVYAETYLRPGLIGPGVKSVMAHCVYSDSIEMEMLNANNVLIAHCPQSNENVASGIAPIRRFLHAGIRVGLGSDVAGGSTLSMFRCIQDAVAVSKLRWRVMDQNDKPLTMDEAFYMATEGGGSFFGKVGTFKPGYEMDALVLPDDHLIGPRHYSVRDRLERVIYSSEPILEGMRMKYVGGIDILKEKHI